MLPILDLFLAQYNVGEIHPYFLQVSAVHTFLLLDSILLCNYITSCLLINLQVIFGLPLL